MNHKISPYYEGDTPKLVLLKPYEIYYPLPNKIEDTGLNVPSIFLSNKHTAIIKTDNKLNTRNSISGRPLNTGTNSLHLKSKK